MIKNYFYFTLLFSCFNLSSQIQKTDIKLKLDALFSNEFKDLEPGGAVLIKKGDNIVYQGSFGLANLDTKEKVTQNTIFNTGSISKTLVSNGILILQERGQLSIEDKISKYFKDFDHPEIIKEITIKHLLSHNSGLPDLRQVNANFKYFLTAKDSGNFEPLKTVDQLNFSPGEKFEYSNPAYNGLALIIEKITKDKWQKFIKENIFNPSGMENSTITDGPHPKDGVAHGYRSIDGKYIESDYGETPTFAAAGNGGIWSTVSDLVKYEQSIQKYTFLSKELIQESRTINQPKNWKDSSGPKIGYSWFITSKKDSKFNLEMISHTGSQGGFNSFYLYFPSKDVLYVGLFNRPLGNSRTKVYSVLDILEEHNWFD